jgi:hypothetical protein
MKWDNKQSTKPVWMEFLDSACGFCYFMLSYLSVIIIRQATLWWKAASHSVTMRALGDVQGIKIRTDHTAVLSELLLHHHLIPHVEQAPI